MKKEFEVDRKKNFYGGEVTAIHGDNPRLWKVKYPADDYEEDLELEDVVGIMEDDSRLVGESPEVLRKHIVDALVPGFEYLENRLTGNCAACYDCSHMYEVCKLLRVFDPSWVVANSDKVDMAFVQKLTAIVPIQYWGLVPKLQQELHKYLPLAKEVESEKFDRSDVKEYTNQVLDFWRRNQSTIPEWATAALIVFSFSGNSAACERVFSLLKQMFGDQQLSALADYVQGSLMLRYNQRVVG